MFKSEHCTVDIADNAYVEGVTFWLENDGSVITIGSKCSFNGKCQLACTEGKRITFGDDCLVSNEIVIRTGDSHSVLDLNGERINQAQDVHIGRHVWIGNRVIILKGASIPSNCIIAAGAVISKRDFDDHTIIAGIPAKVVKEQVDWVYERL